jgi:hypothetical protein
LNTEVYEPKHDSSDDELNVIEEELNEEVTDD